MTENPPQNPEDPRPDVTPGDPLAGEQSAPAGEQTPPTAEQPPPTTEQTPPAAEQPPPTTEQTPPTAEQPATPRRLTRSSTDRVLGGVAGGLARHLAVDPLLVRIVLAVMALAFPPTILGYLVALAVVPSDGAPVADPEHRNRVLAAVVVGLLLLVVLPVAVPFGFIAGPPILGIAVPLLFIGGLIWLVMRVLGADEAGGAGRRIGAAVGIVLLAICGFFAALAAAIFGAGWIVAVVVIVCGVSLMAAAFAGGARWLLAPALLLALPLAGVAAADIELGGGVGDREYRPLSVADLQETYELGAGELELDLREVRFPVGETRVRLDLGMGEARVLVPEGACVVPDVRVGAGRAVIGSRDQAGVDVEWRERASASGTPRILLDAEVGMGELKVGSSRFEGFFHEDEFLQGANACP